MDGAPLIAAVDRYDPAKSPLGRSPTTSELANHLDLTEDEVLDAREAAQTRIGCSQMHVSRLLRRALGRVRAQLAEA